MQKKTFDDDVNFKSDEFSSVKKRYVRTTSTAEATVVAVPNSFRDDAYLSLPTRTWGKKLFDWFVVSRWSWQAVTSFPTFHVVWDLPDYVFKCSFDFKIDGSYVNNRWRSKQNTSSFYSGNQYIASAYKPIKFFHSMVMILASEPNTFVKVKTMGDFDMNENDIVQVAKENADITGIEVSNKNNHQIRTKPLAKRFRLTA